MLGTNVHLWPYIVEARRKGAKFYVIDPVKNRTGKAADRHFAIYPGSDLALALGLMHVILRDSLQDSEYIEEYTNGFEDMSKLAAAYTPERVAGLTGMTAEDVESLAREYATVRPAAIRMNYGVQRSDRGGSAVRAIAALPVFDGFVARPGRRIAIDDLGRLRSEPGRARAARPAMAIVAGARGAHGEHVAFGRSIDGIERAAGKGDGCI